MRASPNFSLRCLLGSAGARTINNKTEIIEYTIINANTFKKVFNLLTEILISSAARFSGLLAFWGLGELSLASFLLETRGSFQAKTYLIFGVKCFPSLLIFNSLIIIRQCGFQ